MYIDELDDIVNKYNNTYHRTTKIKHVDIKPNTNINSSKEINGKDPKFVMLLEYQNIKTFFQNVPN